MATPSLAMIPSAYADSKLYSVLPNNGDGDFTFNRDSSATRIGQNGLIQEVGYFGNDLVSNGDFSNGSTDWGLGSNWSVANGKASCDGSASNSMSQASTVGIASTTFKVSYDVLSISQGSIRITLGGVAGASASQTGSYSDFITATSTDRLRIFADSSAIASIDNIIVQQVTGDQPRLNYDISNGVVQSCPSLLLEPASTNLITYSEDLTQSDWSKNSITVESNAIISPDGTQNADKITKSASNALIRQFITTTGANTFSVYVKKGSLYWVRLYIASSTESAECWFDLENGLTGFTSGNPESVEIVSLSNGWYKCIITKNTTDITNFRIYPSQADDDTSGTSGDIYIYGAQVETLSYATSYIPTNGASQTRAAETCLNAGTASTFNDSEGVLYAEIAALSDDGTSRRISLSDGSISNRISLEIDETANRLKLFVDSSVLTANGITLTNFNKIAAKYKANDYALWVNGEPVATLTTQSNVPTGLEKLDFAGALGGNDFYGNCKDIRVYNEALTDAQLQTLTTL